MRVFITEYAEYIDSWDFNKIKNLYNNVSKMNSEYGISPTRKAFVYAMYMLRRVNNYFRLLMIQIVLEKSLCTYYNIKSMIF